jgi:hypothetical protein
MSLSDIAAMATAAGVVLVAIQLWSSRRQTRTALEDELTKEYRQVALALPPEAFFDPPRGKPASEFRDNRREYLWYIDLSNQQVFLRSQRRVSRGTGGNGATASRTTWSTGPLSTTLGPS